MKAPHQTKAFNDSKGGTLSVPEFYIKYPFLCGKEQINLLAKLYKKGSPPWLIGSNFKHSGRRVGFTLRQSRYTGSQDILVCDAKIGMNVHACAINSGSANTTPSRSSCILRYSYHGFRSIIEFTAPFPAAFDSSRQLR